MHFPVWLHLYDTFLIFFYLSEEHPSMFRTGPIYINCSQLNDEQHITPPVMSKCMIHYMVTLPIYPAHTQTKVVQNWTPHLLFKIYLFMYILSDKWHHHLSTKQTQRSQTGQEKARSLPNYSCAGGSIFIGKALLLVLMPLTLVHVTIIFTQITTKAS